MARDTAAPRVTPARPPSPAPPPRKGVRAALALCFGVPALALVASYFWLAIDNGQWNLWGVIVHESGHYTLCQTVLYFSHFLREIPTVIAYALFLLGLAGGGGHGAVPVDTVRGRRLALIGWGGAVLLVAVAFTAATSASGFSSAARDLLQFRTRDDVSAYGSHWRYHLLSTLWFGLAVSLAPWLTRRLPQQLRFHGSRFWTRAAWAYFLALTVVFGVSAEVFTDTRYAGHQAREIVTHATTTLLLGLGLLLASRRVGPATETARSSAAAAGIPFTLALGIPAYLAAVALSGDVMASGQSEHGLAPMIAGHFFEHTLDYVFALLLLVGGLGSTSWHQRARP